MKASYNNYFVLCALLLLTGCFYTPNPISIDEEKALRTNTYTFDKESYPAENNLFPPYLIKPGDMLDILFQIKPFQTTDDLKILIGYELSIKFVNTPELNETQVVKPDGTIILPYIGQILVVNKSVGDLIHELKIAYSRLLKDPDLYILVLNANNAIKELKIDLHTASRGLSRLATVRPDGFVTFPMLGDVYVAGRKIPDVNRELDEKYSKVMPGLHVDLFLEKGQGAIIFVMGQVNKAGRFEIAKPISVYEAIALANGHRDDARLDNIIVFRRKGNEIIARRIDLMGFLSANEDREYFYLKPDDLVYVPSTNLSSVARMMRHIQDLFFFRGWSLGGDLFTTGLIEIHGNYNRDNNIVTPKQN